MPELPDIDAYLQALAPRIVGRSLDGVWLRTLDELEALKNP